MADFHRSLRAPRWLWDEYGEIVGDLGRTPDLKSFMDWQIDHPTQTLGSDVNTPSDFATTLRMESARWEMFMEVVGEREGQSRLRAYMNWRRLHPAQPLPGRRLGPLRRDSRAAA